MIYSGMWRVRVFVLVFVIICDKEGPSSDVNDTFNITLSLCEFLPYPNRDKRNSRSEDGLDKLNTLFSLFPNSLPEVYDEVKDGSYKSVEEEYLFKSLRLLRGEPG